MMSRLARLIFLTKLLNGCRHIGEGCLLVERWKRHAKAKRRRRRSDDL